MLNAAHEHAANAEDYLSQGLLIPAAEEHFKAAEAYQKALERSNDESAKRTLKMLFNEHHKGGKELQRKIEQLKAEGKDPNLPQKQDVPRSSPMHANNPHPYPNFPHSAPSPPPHRPMTDSQGTVDESFMLLGGQRSDPGDAFNQFWNIMQGMMDNLSQPVAFATAPLGTPDSQSLSPAAKTKLSSDTLLRQDGNLSSDTDIEEPMVARFARRLGMGGDSKKAGRSSSSLKTKVVSAPDLDFDDDLEEGDRLSESFFLIPSGSDSSPPISKQDNVTLRLEIDVLKKRLETAERALQLRREQDAQLRDSIFQATKEAQRAMGASLLVPSASVVREMPGIKTGREAQYARRVKELEEELRTVRSENDKQKAMIVRYQEKWEKLKESAKRRKAAAAVEAVKSSNALARERIPEEPEPDPDGNM